jgi:hypothetical protein
MGRRARVLWGLAAPALVALSTFIAAALATAGPTAAVRPLLRNQTVAHHKGARTLADSPTTTGTTTTVTTATTTTTTTATTPTPGQPTTTGGSLPASVIAEIRANADWIMQSQLPDGAIAWYTDQKHIAPYESGYAALGLARAAQITGNSAYLAAAWRFLSWYQAHEDANGYVTDYDVTNGVETSTGDMDSTDAYAGMFLVAAQATWQVSHDHAQLAGLASGVAGAVKAIESTQTSDGLTWAKPNWQVKYAMDQAETYAGLRAAAQLEETLGNHSLSVRATSDADRLQQGFAQLWDPATGAYDWAMHADGARATTNWANLYPDAMEQAWPVAFGLVTGSHAQQVVQHLASSHPEWDSQYWSVAGWAFQAVGLDSTAQTAAASIEAVAKQSNRAWPFTTADAGQLILLESGGFPS